MTQSDKIMAATEWQSNAHLILDCFKLGYIRDQDHVIDLTYNTGKWWGLAKPQRLIANDWDPQFNCDMVVDFRDTGLSDDYFDVVAFDPPYVAKGGRETSTIDAMDAAYGMREAPKTPIDVQDLINAGVEEAARICKPDGVVLVKCKNYISGGKYFPGVWLTIDNALAWTPLDLEDELIHVGQPGPQSQTSQQHARNNYSVLLVFRRRSQRFVASTHRQVSFATTDDDGNEL